MGADRIIIAVLLLALAVGGVMVFSDSPSRPPDTVSTPKPFLQDIDFDDGADYVLVLTKQGVETIIDQRSVLEN